MLQARHRTHNVDGLVLQVRHHTHNVDGRRIAVHCQARHRHIRPGLALQVMHHTHNVEGRRIAVHCHAGLGRTGLAIASFLVYSGTFSAAEAIERTRAGRPGALQTNTQVLVLLKFTALAKPVEMPRLCCAYVCAIPCRPGALQTKTQVLPFLRFLAAFLLRLTQLWCHAGAFSNPSVMPHSCTAGALRARL